MRIKKTISKKEIQEVSRKLNSALKEMDARRVFNQINDNTKRLDK